MTASKTLQISSCAESLRQRLRTETDSLHQALHHNPGLRQLMSSNCAELTYRNVLNVFFMFYRKWEHFFAIDPVYQFTSEARPLVWLNSDFERLQHDPSAKVTKNFIVDAQTIGKDEFIHSTSLDAYLGYLYVKQGSTLGGQAISKQLNKSLGLEPGQAQFFFHGFGANTGAHWNAFLNYLANMEQYLDADSVIHYANRFFELLNSAFNQHFPEET